jgi:hypothetical protein
MFAELDDDEMTWVAELATEFEVPAGFVLIERGQPGSGMFIITDGTVTVELPQGPVELGRGEFVGELPLLADGITRVARVRATPLKGLAISRAWPRRALQREPRVAVRMRRSSRDGSPRPRPDANPTRTAATPARDHRHDRPDRRTGGERGRPDQHTRRPDGDPGDATAHQRAPGRASRCRRRHALRPPCWIDRLPRTIAGRSHPGGSEGRRRRARGTALLDPHVALRGDRTGPAWVIERRACSDAHERAFDRHVARRLTVFRSPAPCVAVRLIHPRHLPRPS